MINSQPSVTGLDDRPPSLENHRPEFLWNLTRNELVTTKFMRNRVLFSTLAQDLLPRLRKQKGSPLRLLFWACSIGCEPYTLKFLLGPDSTDEIIGIDQDAEAIRQARLGIYHPDTWTMFVGQKNLLTETEINQLFEPISDPASKSYKIAEPYRKKISFLTGNLFSAEPTVPIESFDLVVCNNLLLHLKPHSANLAWDYLHRYLNTDGLLLIAGCNPNVRASSAKRLNLAPCTEKLNEISKNWHGVSGGWNFNPRPAWAYPEPDQSDPDYQFLAGEIFKKEKRCDEENSILKNRPTQICASISSPAVRIKNIVISGTNFWNPGDDFVRDGVIRVLKEVFKSETLNFLFYNFNPDFFPQEKFAGIGNYVSKGDLEKYRDFVDAVVIAGLSAGDEIKDLYRWVVANGMEEKVYLIGAGYENSYVANHISEEPEATIFRKARVVLGRTAKAPEFIRAAGIPYLHVNCPAILSVPEVKKIASGHKIKRIGFSIQLPHDVGLPNHSCAPEQYKLAVEILCELFREYEVEIVAHHKTEYFHFLELFRGKPVPVIFSSFYQDLQQIYPRYDLVITTRLHSSLFANGHGIPGIIINDTDRHTHALEGFPHSTWVSSREGFECAFKTICDRSLTDIAREAGDYKRELLAKYGSVLSNAFHASPRDAADGYSFESEKKEQMLVRSLVKPGMVVFDVGANIGKYTKLFSLLVGDSGKVFAFEPDPDSAQRVYKLVADDALANVRVLNQAVSEASGKVTLNRFPEEYCSWNSLGHPQMEDPRNPSQLVPIVSSVEVEAVTLDGFCQSHGIAQIDYVKLDVEGAEFRALQGAQGLLKKQAIRFLQFEVSLKMLEGLNTCARPVFDLLASFGYECHAISEDGKMLGVVSDSNEFYENYIAIPVKTDADKIPDGNVLPIHFFTIVLNGLPFIRHHIETFKNLPFDWHWHIVEGVAELNHDTAWSKATGGKIPDQLHCGGLSVDGTAEYLDALKKEFPDNVTIYRPRPGKFWDGKREMVNAPLANLPKKCLLWQVDADELWTFSQIIRTRSLFLAHPKKTAALFYCHYFVGPELVVTSRDTYGNNSSYEWLRVWRYQSGDRWIAHEPPRLCRGELDVTSLDAFRHAETEAMGLVFQHYAYAIEEQIHFKEAYYGYTGAVEQWRHLQQSKKFPQRLAGHFAWVKDEAIVNTVASAGIKRIAADEWLGITTTSHASALDGAERILFVRTDSIGDAVMASSMLEPIRKKYPQAKLAILCQQHVAELFVACPFVDSIICYDRKKMEVPSEREQIVAEIAAFNPDVILNPVRSRDHFSNQLTQAFRGARHIAIEGDRNNISEADHAHSLDGYELLIPSPEIQKLELERHADFLRGLGIETKNLQPVVWTSPDDEALADIFFKQQNLDPQKTIAIFPGAQYDIRVYGGYVEALKKLDGFRFLIFGDASQAKLTVEIESQLGGSALNLCGRSSLRETAALVRRCRVYVGAESAGAHIACAVGVPNVVLVGGGHFGRFMTYSPLTSAVVLPLDCFGCDWRCPHSRAHCVKDISLEVLVEAIQRTFEKNSARPRIFLQSADSWHGGTVLPAWKNPISFLEGMDVEIIKVAAGPQVNLPVENQSQKSATAVCPVCQISAPVNVVKKGQQYYVCPTCDCVFTPHIDKDILQTENNGYTARHNHNQDAIRLLRMMTALGRRPDQVMDFGCGKGETTKFIQSRGINAIGIDQNTTLQLKDVADDSMDGIMMVEVIEHLFDPHTIFSQFNRILKPGGVIYVESSFADKKELATWSYLDPAIGHCTVHSLRSMDLVARKNGFEISWMNPHVCCFTKKVAVKLKGENSMLDDNIEIVGEGISNPVVTVVVSTYQSEKFIRACLENLSRQTIFNRCEIIVVDSGSPENERAIIAEFQEKFPNIRYIRTQRETLYGAWNRGLALARGNYWANVNTDDSLRDDALEILASALDKHTDCALAYVDAAWTTKANDIFPSTNIVRTVKYPDYAPIETLFYCITGCMQFFRTDALRQLGGFDASLRCAGDYEATLKIMASKMNAVRVPEVLSLFYQNTVGLTQADNRAALEHDQVMDRYRANLDIANIFQIEPGDLSSVANAWATLGARATRFSIPWEDKPFEHLDFAIACYQKALDLNPQNDLAATGLCSLYKKLNRLLQVQAELLKNRPYLKSVIERVMTGEPCVPPNAKHALIGLVYRPAELTSRPTMEQLAREPEALRSWICRIDGRHVYLSEELFPRPAGLFFRPEELQVAAEKLTLLLAKLPQFYAHFGGAGDALLLLASFYDKSPNAIIFSHPNGVGAMKAFFEAFPKLSKIYFLPQHVEPFFHIVLRFAVYQLRNCLGAGATPKESYDVEWKAGLDIEKKYRIGKAPRWAADFRKNQNSRHVAVAPKGSLTGMVGSKRNIILPENWPQVLSHLQARGFEPVILGTPSEAKEYPALPGCIDARAESFAGQMQHIGRCVGLVGADSWAKTFSALAEIPTLVFEPLKSADLASWKDASDWIFIEPWPVIKMIRSLEDFRREFDARIAKISNASVPDVSKAVIAWEGSFLDYGSLSHINRELTARLSGNLNLTRIGSNALVPKIASDPAMQRCVKTLAAKSPANTNVTVRHQWPPNWSRPENGSLVVIQPWEYGALPKAWIANEKNVDEFWVPSPIVRGMYLDSGIAPEKVRVVPNGVDTKKFHPDLPPLALPTKKKFKFLFVGGTIYRKGPDVLLDAFQQAFTATDDICLVIKDFGGDSFYQGQTAEAAIRAIQKNPNAPEIIHLTKEISADDMPSLYAACDCLVLPYRGEGFGMPVLEAMACGLPVIVTAGGATDSFVPADAGWKIPSRGIRLNDRVGEIPLVKNGWLLEPSKAHLISILRLAANRPDECCKRGANGRAIAEKRFDWNDIAASVAHRLCELAERALTKTNRTFIEGNQIPAKKIELPLVALVGQLNEARELFQQKKFQLAWESANAAIVKRPFHPEAFLLLAEIALAGGNTGNARFCAQHAAKIAPGWNAPKQFLKKPLKGNVKLEWLKLLGIVQSKSPRLTVCLVVKNEEKFLAQCLKSVRYLAQQIIVVDTGSTDRTLEIAKEFGAEIYSFAWCDDFSAARNAALEYATGDWILMLDADEELPEAEHEKLRADMKKSDAIALRLPLINREHEAEGQNFVPRLFRNAPGVHYFGRVHEQVFPSLLPLGKSWGLKTAFGTAQLLHHGYTKEMVRDRNKIERNLKLLRQAVEENPADANLMMNFGLELVRSDDLAGGVAKYRAAFELMSAQPADEIAPELREVLLTQFTCQLYKIRAHEEVVRVLNSTLAKNSGLTASLHFALGLSQFELKNYGETAKQMQQCLAKRKQPALSPINTDILTIAPEHCLALSLVKLGDAVGAEKAFQAALSGQDQKNFENVKLDYVKFLAGQNRAVEALQKLHEMVAANARNVVAWRTGGEIALSRPEFLEFARDWTGEAMRYAAEDSVVTAQRAEALMLSGDMAAAMELWEQVWNSEREPRILAAMILCEAVESPTTHAPQDEQEEVAISRAFIGWYRKLLTMKAQQTIVRLNEQTDKLSRALPGAAKILEATMAEVDRGNVVKA
jgi:FkbM family methyltransferase